MAAILNDIKKWRKVVQIALAVILTLGLSLTHACAALSFFGSTFLQIRQEHQP